MLRQFHTEGFVNQYVEDTTSPSTRVVFNTEAIENIPAGWRARETYVLHGPDRHAGPRRLNHLRQADSREATPLK